VNPYLRSARPIRIIGGYWPWYIRVSSAGLVRQTSIFAGSAKQGALFVVAYDRVTDETAVAPALDLILGFISRRPGLGRTRLSGDTLGLDNLGKRDDGLLGGTAAQTPPVVKKCSVDGSGFILRALRGIGIRPPQLSRSDPPYHHQTNCQRQTPPGSSGCASVRVDGGDVVACGSVGAQGVYAIDARPHPCHHASHVRRVYDHAGNRSGDAYCEATKGKIWLEDL